MKAAWEYKAEFTPKGQCIRKEYSIGGIVIWAIVAVIAIWQGVAWLPSTFWRLFH